MKETFTFVTSAKNKPTNEIEFESDNVFKDIAKMISEIDLSLYSNGCTVEVYDENGRYEEFWVIKKASTYFVRYGQRYDNKFKNRIDYDIPPRYLTCLDTKDNEYKYYMLAFNKNDEECIADYGRIGQEKGSFNYKGANKDGSFTYPAQMYWIKYYEKINKGYVDQSEEKDFSRGKVNSKERDYKPIEEPVIREVFKRLLDKQRDAVFENFDMTVPPSQKAISNAKNLIDKINVCLSMEIDDTVKRSAVCQLYKSLIVTLPRKIPNVAEYVNRISLNKDSDNYIGKILDEEAELLQNLIDVCQEQTEEIKEEEPKDDILTFNGLSCNFCDYETKWEVLERLCSEDGRGVLRDERHLVKDIIAVNNTRTEHAFNDMKKSLGIKDSECHLLFHGSRTENWWSILKNGMSLNPNAVITGKAFGQGLYFAPLARKSLGYTDFKGSYWASGRQKFGYLALFDVAMGKPKADISRVNSSFSAKDLKKGEHSVWAYAGAKGFINEECIVYREEQCTVRYLIEMDADRVPFYNFDIRQIQEMKASVSKATDDTIEFTTNLHKYVKNAPVNAVMVYDKSKETLLEVKGMNFSQQELDYLAEICESNFAKTKEEFRKKVLGKQKEKDEKEM